MPWAAASPLALAMPLAQQYEQGLGMHRWQDRMMTVAPGRAQVPDALLREALHDAPPCTQVLMRTLSSSWKLLHPT